MPEVWRLLAYLRRGRQRVVGGYRRRLPQGLSPRFIGFLFLLVLIGLAGIPLGIWQTSPSRSGGERPLEQLGRFGTVPEFTLIERTERQVTRGDLLGLVWVANFFYASCPDTCPLQSDKMARLQEDVADASDVRLVSISVDPERDTPAVLRDYAQRFAADPERWLFLTGDKTAIYRLAQEGFHLSVVDPHAMPSHIPEKSPQGGLSESQPGLRSRSRAAHHPSSGLFKTLWYWAPAPRLVWAHDGVEHPTALHSSRFVLIDRQAHIRGYYHSDDEAALQRLRRDIHLLLRESGGRPPADA